MNGEQALARIRSTLQQKLAETPAAKSLLDKINSGRATCEDTALYARWAAINLGICLSDVICEIDFDDRAAICKALLLDQYNDINKIVDTVQAELDSRFGVHLAPQRAPFNEERADTIGHSLADTTKPDAVIQRRARSATETAVKSMHDDRMKTEAKFRSRLGLNVTIERRGSDCCAWCAAVAGRYRMGEEPEGIFRRHDNCDCTVIYDSQVLRGAVGKNGKRTKTWTEVEPKKVRGLEPMRLTKEQAAQIEAQHQPAVLTGGKKPDIINQKISDRMFNSHVYTDDEKKLAEMGVIPFSEIEDALMASPIGRNAAQYIESQSMAIELDYISDANGLNGEINDPFITVYVADMRTIEEVVETIVHETAHKQFDWQYTQEDEINCRIYEYLSTHDKITEQKIHEIVDFVREYYSDFPEGNLYGY